MSGADLEHPPPGVVMLPTPDGNGRALEPRAWVEQVRRPETRRLEKSVAEHLADAREHGEA